MATLALLMLTHLAPPARTDLDWDHQWRLWTRCEDGADKVLVSAERRSRGGRPMELDAETAAARLWLHAQVRPTGQGGLEGEVTLRILRLAAGAGRTQELVMRVPMTPGQPVVLAMPDLDAGFPPLWLEWEVRPGRTEETNHGHRGGVSAALRAPPTRDR